jgi:hypothetical protein
MAQRFGAVFGIAIGTTVFGSYGRLGTPATMTAGFEPALWTCAALAVLATLSALAITSSRRQAPNQAELADLPIAA